MHHTAFDGAEMNLRMATMQLAGMRLPPRVKTIPSVRRRLPVTDVSDPPQAVKIRQAVPNVDRAIIGNRPPQSQRV